jgi:hypothetical protein
MSTLDLSYEDFAALCEELLGDATETPQRPPRVFGSGQVNPRFRGRWFVASGGFASAGRLGLRRRLGFPRGRR